MNEDQLKFLNDLDSNGMRPFIESVVKRISITTPEIAYLVDDDRQGYLPQRRPLAAGVLRYCKNDQTLYNAALDFGYVIIPNRYRTTVRAMDSIVQIRRFSDLETPPGIRKDTSQYEMFAEYTTTHTLLFILEYFEPIKKGEVKTFINKFAHSEIYLATLNSELNSFEVYPVKADDYLSGEHQKIDLAKFIEKPKAKRNIRESIKKDLQKKRQERGRRSNI